MESIELATFKIDLSSLNETLDKVRKEISKQKCKNCKHWRVVKVLKDMGTCDNKKAFICKSIVSTEKDFGCKLFEKK
jgi:hypothetical protein